MGRDHIRQDARAWAPLDATTQTWLLSALAVAGPDAAAPTAAVDWSTLARRAHSDGLAPLLHRAIEESSISVPPSFADAMRRSYYQSVSVNHLRLTQLERMGQLLARENIPLMALKGGALATTIYDDPGLRFMGDLDVTVPPEQTMAALNCLTAAGYRPIDDPSLSTETLVNEGWHIRLVKDVHGRELETELHWPNRRRVLVTQLARLDIDALWATAVPLEAHHPVRQPAAPFMMLHLALHLGLQHRFTDLGLRSLVDIDRLVRRAGPSLWATLPALARHARARHVTYYVLDLATRLLGTPVPSDVTNALAPDANRRRLFQHSLPPTAVINRQRAFYGPQRRLWRTLTSDRPYHQAIAFWQEMFPGRRYLATYYQSAHRGRVAAYVLWHPVHALLRAGRRRWRERPSNLRLT